MNLAAYLNENETYISNQMKNGLRFLIKQIRETDDFKHYGIISQILNLCGPSCKADLTEISLEGGFLEWNVCQLDVLIESAASYSPSENMKKLILFHYLTQCTDGSKQFCEKLSKNKIFLSIAKRVMESDEEIDEHYKEYLVFILNNICFHFTSQYLMDLDLKEFLIQRAENKKERFCCIFTLLRILSKEEIWFFEDIVCSIVKKFQKMILEAKDDDQHQCLSISGMTSLEELLINLEPLSKCEKAKELLVTDKHFLVGIKEIVTLRKYSKYSRIMERTLPLFFTAKEISEMKKEY